MKENKLLRKLRFYYQIFLTSFTGNTNYFSLIKIYASKIFHKRNTQKSQITNKDKCCVPNFQAITYLTNSLS